MNLFLCSLHVGGRRRGGWCCGGGGPASCSHVRVCMAALLIALPRIPVLMRAAVACCSQGRNHPGTPTWPLQTGRRSISALARAPLSPGPRLEMRGGKKNKTKRNETKGKEKKKRICEPPAKPVGADVGRLKGIEEPLVPRQQTKGFENRCAIRSGFNASKLNMAGMLEAEGERPGEQFIFFFFIKKRKRHVV